MRITQCHELLAIWCIGWSTGTDNLLNSIKFALGNAGT